MPLPMPVKYTARKRIVEIFMNSEGCTPSSPMPSQARAPFTSRPKSRVTTISSRFAA